jgi:hypothetical protein
MKSETRLEEQSSESALDPILIPSPETAEAVAIADAAAQKRRKKRLDVRHVHREEKPLAFSVPPYEIRLFRKNPEPIFALYGLGPRTGRLPKRADKYVVQGSLEYVFKKMKELLLADGIQEHASSQLELKEIIALVSFYLEDFMMDAIEESGKAGDTPE